MYMGKERGGWRPQLSVLNCNKPRVWQLLTAPKQATFHYLERKDTKQRLIYDVQNSTFIDFQEKSHTPDW